MWRSRARALLLPRSSAPSSAPPQQNPLRSLARAPPPPPRLLSRFLSSSSSSQKAPPAASPPSSSSPGAAPGSAAPPAYTGNLKKALAGLRRIDLEGLRWRVFDAKGQVLGRLASQIAVVLQGKDKPTYAPHVEAGDMCIVLNAKDICVTGRKMTDKIYYWHTGYIGHLKERKLKDQMAKDPTEVIRKAVMRMLPRNKLRDDRDRKLRIFAEGEHPFHDRPLEPFVMPPRQVREMRPRARRAMIRAQKKDQDREAKKAEGEAAKNGKAAVAA
ncbi:hypothetical protein CFC21_090203 [Triticum aestivum]|uniref:50S ribosomal protein L13 n=3 Tax=Triticum TaxID=4564 RepID=A0A9R1BFV6_TRITD|nr:50S ribosomal protein L13-like [Triticum aestivum]KAF7086971.1 hypothetical protein CFC21_090203 [Triticum aestivum]VAI63121.1 unnamed protein product [Triticum turgidum subsp. durum]